MEDRIILIDKPAGISSFGVVSKVRGKLRADSQHKVKVGHTGTLDPFATGLLILLSGKMTKKSNEFLKLDKVYEATLKFGYVSSTGDPEGEIIPYVLDGVLDGGLGEGFGEGLGGGISEGLGEDLRGGLRESFSEERKAPSLEEIEGVLGKFLGEIQQTVPRFSAVKINGERAYKLARRGEEPVMPTRNVTIYSLEILSYNYPELKLRCHVSSGTYIRALAEDIGKELGVGAYLTALRRIKVGEYEVKDAVELGRYLKIDQNR
ncbi:MAG: tRNA pseudouridine(55) synthase TruB [Candidatus Saccharibacteria bacterium]|nr:tRNA pseudouridine(55) synthase TruB [Candidatus Saccharibacteria bacterium]